MLSSFIMIKTPFKPKKRAFVPLRHQERNALKNKMFIFKEYLSKIPEGKRKKEYNLLKLILNGKRGILSLPKEKRLKAIQSLENLLKNARKPVLRRILERITKVGISAALGLNLFLGHVNIAKADLSSRVSKIVALREDLNAAINEFKGRLNEGNINLIRRFYQEGLKNPIMNYYFLFMADSLLRKGASQEQIAQVLFKFVERKVVLVGRYRDIQDLDYILMDSSVVLEKIPLELFDVFLKSIDSRESLKLFRRLLKVNASSQAIKSFLLNDNYSKRFSPIENRELAVLLEDPKNHRYAFLTQNFHLLDIMKLRYELEKLPDLERDFLLEVFEELESHENANMIYQKRFNYILKVLRLNIPAKEKRFIISNIFRNLIIREKLSPGYVIIGDEYLDVNRFISCARLAFKRAREFGVIDSIIKSSLSRIFYELESQENIEKFMNFAFFLREKFGIQDRGFQGSIRFIEEFFKTDYKHRFTSRNFDLSKFSETLILMENSFDFLEKNLKEKIEDFNKIQEIGIENAKTLHYNFGIRRLSRFSTKFLEQVLRINKNGLDPNKELAIVFTPRADHNGAFYNDLEIFDSLLKGYNIIPFEVGTEMQFEYYLSRVTAKYGQSSAIVIGGHGEPSELVFGRGNIDSGKLDLTDIVEMKRIERSLKENSKVVLLSCSTGTQKGLADIIASSLRKRIEVFAPNNPTNLKEFIFDEKGRIIRAIYNSGTRSYQSKP
jgi:hypothetical protein